MMKNDLVKLQHMRDASREIINFTAEKSRADLDSDRKLSLSLVHLLEIIGEAATGISNAAVEEYKDITWSSIIGMRNRLIHGYFDIDLDIVWQTVQNDIPDLLQKLELIIKEIKK